MTANRKPRERESTMIEENANSGSNSKIILAAAALLMLMLMLALRTSPHGSTDSQRQVGGRVLEADVKFSCPFSL